MITSNLPPMEINNTCSVTGHRVIPDDIDKLKLKNLLIGVINDGFNIFLIGMALGFDLLCFSILSDLKTQGYNVKICAVVPCCDQDKYFSEKERELYNQCLSKADYLAIEEREYFKNCMLIRDDFLIDNSSLVIAYFDGRKKGGTAYTVKKAEKKQMKIINLKNM